MRFGIHSGAVTAGILLGEKARFQLFGDTVNMASRMESTGERSRIQMSHSTADRLTATGKGAWIRPRDEKIQAKGKGMLQTYWLASRPHVTSVSEPNRRSSLEHLLEKSNEKLLNQRSGSRNNSRHLSGSLSGESSSTEDEEVNRSTRFDSKSDLMSVDRNRRRVINWQSELLLKSLKLIEAHRVHKNDTANMEDMEISGMKGSIVLDEVVGSIALPKFDEERFHARQDPSSVVLSEAVVSQVSSINTFILVEILKPPPPTHCFSN
jgi:Adenylate and Guanylate cyclase catalytic domain